MQDNVWTVKQILRASDDSTVVYVTGIDSRPDHDLYICSGDAQLLTNLREQTLRTDSPLVGLHNRRTPLYLRCTEVEPMYAIALARIMETRRNLGNSDTEGVVDTVEVDMGHVGDKSKRITGAANFASARTDQQRDIFFRTTNISTETPTPDLNLAITHHMTQDQHRSAVEHTAYGDDTSETVTEESESFRPILPVLTATAIGMDKGKGVHRNRRRIPRPNNPMPTPMSSTALLDSDDDEADFAYEESSESGEDTAVMTLLLANRRYREMNTPVRTTPSVAHHVVSTYRSYHPQITLEDAVQWYATDILEKRWFCVNGLYAILYTKPRALGFEPYTTRGDSEHRSGNM